MQKSIFTMFTFGLVLFSLYFVVHGSDPQFSSTTNLFDTVRYFVSEATRVLKYVSEVFTASVEEDCVFECPNGAIPKPNIYYHPVGNGCGVPGFKVPDYIPLKTLEDCCNSHDICYGTCQKDKEKCDNKFKKCLYSICSSLKKIINDNTLDTGCKSVAKTFYLAVIAGGCKHYLDAQKEACLCDLNYHYEF